MSAGQCSSVVIRVDKTANTVSLSLYLNYRQLSPFLVLCSWIIWSWPWSSSWTVYRWENNDGDDDAIGLRKEQVRLHNDSIKIGGEVWRAVCSLFKCSPTPSLSPSPQCSLLHCFSAFRRRINIWYNFWPEKNWAEKTGNFWRSGVPSVLANAAFSAPLQYLHIPHHLLWHKWRDANCSKAKISQELEEIQLCNILKHLLHNAPCPLWSVKSPK